MKKKDILLILFLLIGIAIVATVLSFRLGLFSGDNNTPLDEKGPIINYRKELTIDIGDNIDLLKDVEVSDDYDSNPSVKVIGDYDTSKEGIYNLKYEAKDASGNITTVDFKLIVKSTSSSSNADTFVTSKGFNGKVVDGVTYIEGILIANKSYPLPENYGSGLIKECENAFYKMQSDAKKENITIFVKSGYRSYIDQKIIYNNYVARDGINEADRYSARPGHSEHQSGYALDINVLDYEFDKSPEGKWLYDNAYKYGFILRYTKQGEEETGYLYEPWHYRYVGTDLAEKLYNGGNWITLENYFGITSNYE